MSSRWPLLLVLLCGACSPKVSTTRIETHAESIEQPAPGMSLLAAAPVPKKRILQLTLGGGHSFAEAPGHGVDGTALYQAQSAAAGHLMFGIAENLELGLTGRWSVSATEGAPGAPPPPAEKRPVQGGVRLRGLAGDGTLRLGWAAEAGFRRVNYAYGVSVACEVDEPLPREYVPIEGTCRASRRLQGHTFTSDDLYLAASVYPVLRLADGLYLYAGVSLDQLTTGYMRADIVERYENGGTITIEKDEEAFDTETVFVPVAGLEVAIDGGLGLLFMVKAPPLGSIDLPGPVYEGALTVAF
jgi:hypothetical protein